MRLTFFDGVLYGFVASGEILHTDEATGVGTVVHHTPFGFWGGAVNRGLTRGSW